MSGRFTVVAPAAIVTWAGSVHLWRQSLNGLETGLDLALLAWTSVVYLRMDRARGASFVKLGALTLDREQGFREKLEANGVTFVTDVDRKALAEKTKVVYGQIKQWSPGLYDKVQAAMGK